MADALDAEYNRVYLDPVFRGAYPEGMRPEMRPSQSLIKDGDMELISAPIDSSASTITARTTFARRLVRPTIGESQIPDYPVFVNYLAPGLERTVTGWPIVPESMREL